MTTFGRLAGCLVLALLAGCRSKDFLSSAPTGVPKTATLESDAGDVGKPGPITSTSVAAPVQPPGSLAPAGGVPAQAGYKSLSPSTPGADVRPASAVKGAPKVEHSTYYRRDDSSPEPPPQADRPARGTMSPRPEG